jgi:aminocarboxymuconate-semialdehyde decarboxylase
VYADSLTHSPRALRFLVDVLGEDHVMLGSDYPFDMGVADPHGEMVKAITDTAVQEKVAGATAGRLLGITEQ